MPERCEHHVLDLAFFAVSQFDFGSGLPFADALYLAADFARFFEAFARAFAAVGAGFGFWFFTDAGRLPAGVAGFRGPVPFLIAEVVVSLHEIVDCEIVFAVEESRASTDDLLEFDHGIDGPH